MTQSSTSNSSLLRADNLDSPRLIKTSNAWVSNEAQMIFQWVCYGVVLGIISSFGTVTNIINIICFVKQGLKDSVNVSLLGLSISDLGCVVTMLWESICFNPAVHQSDLPFDSIDVAYLTGGWFHVIFARVTSWITAFITLERCLCITMPLKVKSIVTPSRTAIIIVFIFIVLTCSVSPVFYANNLALKYSPERNKTIIRLIFTSDRPIVEAISFAINSLLIPFTAFFMVVACTIVLVLKLRNQATWRQKCTGSSTGDGLSQRDRKVAKMVVMISTLFISCFIPICFACVATLAVPGITIDGVHRNMLLIIVGLSFVLETTNSAINIFIYYNMSSRYRNVFRLLCACDKTQ